ncbi:unnamed protein product [Leptosia nina]|uniref:inositol-1,4-bisphosphate 1-phosphatase n=1 Tax=Leptosia nina TaxID=320188 RepID=A0AAV1J9J6_9NEOP
MHLVETLIYASEKAARIARSCCRGRGESLLVSEKESDANPRFDKDFKTIADVLAQESAKAFIVSRIPELANNVRGEECAEIGGITISLKETEDETVALLKLILPEETARYMAEAAHGDVTDIQIESLQELLNLDYSDLGVWIDPIDGTAEFISGIHGNAESGHGLPCVTVLIGAYLKSTGEPIAGVINQPFFNGSKVKIVWGVNYGDQKYYSSNIGNDQGKKVILMSSSENPAVINEFRNLGWEIDSVPGAGHKLLKVASGEASAYIVSKGTTFKWDTCGPHSIICALGGNILSYKGLSPLQYNDPNDLDTQEYCNKDGIVAFTNNDILKEIKEIVCKLNA